MAIRCGDSDERPRGPLLTALCVLTLLLHRWATPTPTKTKQTDAPVVWSEWQRPDHTAVPAEPPPLHLSPASTRSPPAVVSVCVIDQLFAGASHPHTRVERTATKADTTATQLPRRTQQQQRHRRRNRTHSVHPNRHHHSRHDVGPVEPARTQSGRRDATAGCGAIPSASRRGPCGPLQPQRPAFSSGQSGRIAPSQSWPVAPVEPARQLQWQQQWHSEMEWIDLVFGSPRCNSQRRIQRRHAHAHAPSLRHSGCARLGVGRRFWRDHPATILQCVAPARLL